MPDLSFTIEGAEAVPYSAAPLLALKLRVKNADPKEPIRAVMLQCQIQIEATRRHYAPAEQAGLLDLFGTPDRWSQTLRSTLWTHAHVNVGPFSGETLVDLPVPCTFDFNIAATKYFHALERGEVPLCLLFSGTIFYDDVTRGVQIAQIPWSKEARFRLPVHVWKNLMDLYYPNTAWLALRRDVFDRLHEFKMLHGLPTWEQAMERLLGQADEKTLSDEKVLT
jgi:hypothetical protein